MINRVFALGAIFMLVLLSAASAADLNGKWKGVMKTPDGADLEISFDFKVDGPKLTGTVTSSYGEEQITEGVVSGDTVTFLIMAGGGQFKINYKGKLEGEDLKMSVVIGDMGESQFTAKRVA